jgi:hypothetical protein
MVEMKLAANSLFLQVHDFTGLQCLQSALNTRHIET